MIRKSNGFTLIELVIVAAIGTVVAVGLATVMAESARTQATAMTLTQLDIVRRTFIQTILNDQAWSNTIQAGTGTASQMDCLTDPTAMPCTPNPPQNFALYDSNNVLIYDATNLHSGFTPQGTVCHTYSDAGDDTCPFRMDLKWSAACSNSYANCDSPLILVTATALYSPATKKMAFNPADYSIAALYRWPQIPALPPPSAGPGPCAKFKIVGGNTITIPARTAANICYAVWLMGPIALSPSNLTPSRDPQVLAANHDITGTNLAPYLMAQTQFSVTVLGTRSIILSGAVDTTTPVLADNFFLIGINSSKAALIPQNYVAYGTADSAINGGTGVQMNGVTVPIVPLAPAGTASLNAVDISQPIPIGQKFRVDVRGEDCGTLRQLSMVYMIFD